MRRQKQRPLQDENWGAEDGGPRVLIEDADGALAWARAARLRGSGFRVATCDGPSPRFGVGCPLAHGEPCALAEEADVVLCNVHVLDGADALLPALSERHPGRVVREFAYNHDPGDSPVFEGVTPVAFPATEDDLVGAFRRVLPRDGN